MRKPYLLILAICFFSCEEPPVFEAPDPVDTPVVAIQTIETTFTALPIMIEWEGIVNSRKFVYKLQYIDDPSIVHSWNELDTTNATSITFDNLDEGNYTFSVFGLYNKEVIGNVENFSFAVDAIQGPALRIYPLYQSANTGDEIDVYLYFEDVPGNSSARGVHVDIEIDLSEFSFVPESYAKGALITQYANNATAVLWPSSPQYNSDNSAMSIDGVVSNDGSGLWGTGPIAKFSLRVEANNTSSEDKICEIKIKSEDVLIYDSQEPPQQIQFPMHVNGVIAVKNTTDQ